MPPTYHRPEPDSKDTTAHTNRIPDPCSDSLPTIRPGAEKGGEEELEEGEWEGEVESPVFLTTISQTSDSAGKVVAEVLEVLEVHESRPFQGDHSSRSETR